MVPVSISQPSDVVRRDWSLAVCGSQSLIQAKSVTIKVTSFGRDRVTDMCNSPCSVRSKDLICAKHDESRREGQSDPCHSQLGQT